MTRPKSLAEFRSFARQDNAIRAKHGAKIRLASFAELGALIGTEAASNSTTRKAFEQRFGPIATVTSVKPLVGPSQEDSQGGPLITSAASETDVDSEVTSKQGLSRAARALALAGKANAGPAPQPSTRSISASRQSRVDRALALAGKAASKPSHPR